MRPSAPLRWFLCPPARRQRWARLWAALALLAAIEAVFWRAGPAGSRLAQRYDVSHTLGMKTAISIPDDIFEAADRTAANMGLSRSALYARAVREFLDRLDTARVTERLDAVYAERDSTLDPQLAAMQFLSLGAAEEW